MVYQNKLVAAIKVGGKILRESSNTVTIPFGSEYSVFLKNLNSVRVLCKVSVDGKDATEGTWLIIPANGGLELERFIRNGNFERGNRFKFIERTAEIEESRGIGAEDGLIRVEYKTEKVTREETIVRKQIIEEEYRPWRYPYFYPRPYPYPGAPRHQRSGPMGSTRNRVPTRSLGSLRANARSANAPRMDSAFSASIPSAEASLDTELGVGITVSGSVSNQKFVTGEWFPTEAQSDVIVLRLRGTFQGKPVAQPVTVDHKPKCETCGRVNKANSTYCSQCGTALEIIA